MTGPTSHNAASIPKRSSRSRLLCLAGALAALCLFCALSLAVGTRETSWQDVMTALRGQGDPLLRATVELRIPRTLLAVLSGAALALAGAVMQGITRNPLADPGILGVNTGATLAVVIGIAWFGMSTPYQFVTTAISGAALAAIFVYTIGSLGRGGATPLKLALAGAATSIAFSSLVLAVVLPRNDIAGGIQDWQIGGVGGATMDRTLAVLPVFLVGYVVSLVCARKLNLVALGDDLAAGLGERVQPARIGAAFGAIVLCGAATSLCGPIGFVGLVVPHFCRLLVGIDHRWLLPLCALCGAALLTGADIMGRIVARPAELDVGIVTAMIGGPIFISLVRHRRVREL